MRGKLISDCLMICGTSVSQWSVILNHFAFSAISDYIRELKAIERPQSRVIFEVWKKWGKLISDCLMICGILVSQWSVILNHFAFSAISDYIRELKAIERPQSRVIFDVRKMWGKLISDCLMICGTSVSQWSVILNHFAFSAISDYIRELKAIERPQSRVIFERLRIEKIRRLRKFRESTVSEERSARGKWQWASESVVSERTGREPGALWARKSLCLGIMSDYIRELKAIERPQSRVIFEVWKKWGKLISDCLMICGILVSQWSVILNHFAFSAISDYKSKKLEGCGNSGKALWARSGVREGSDSERANRWWASEPVANREHCEREKIYA
jgi:hypothetical protein